MVKESKGYDRYRNGRKWLKGMFQCNGDRGRNQRKWHKQMQTQNGQREMKNKRMTRDAKEIIFSQRKFKLVPVFKNHG